MTADLLFTREGQLGLICLNRPNALNALTLPMILALQNQLQLWKEDSSVHAVVLSAVPGKAFCAGGDIRALYDAGKSRIEEAMPFFWHEYRLNHFIHDFGKPYIALIDGIVMGGGVGISLHGSHPVASERLTFAMPETGIGFFPDIGASHLLNRCPGSLGVYLALTGDRLQAQDALKAGLVKYLVPSGVMPEVIPALQQLDLSQDADAKVDACLQGFQQPQSSDESSKIHPLIDTCFSQQSIEALLNALQNSDSNWAAEVYQNLQKKSPLSLKITLAQLQRTKHQPLSECLKVDYNLVGHFMQGSDFYEGVRALLIDKDQKPRWNPASLNLVRDEMVIGYFEQFGGGLEF